MPDELWTVREVASYLKIPVQGVYLMVFRRQIPFRKLGQRVRFIPREIEQWVSARPGFPAGGACLPEENSTGSPAG